MPRIADQISDPALTARLEAAGFSVVENTDSVLEYERIVGRVRYQDIRQVVTVEAPYADDPDYWPVRAEFFYDGQALEVEGFYDYHTAESARDALEHGFASAESLSQQWQDFHASSPCMRALERAGAVLNAHPETEGCWSVSPKPSKWAGVGTLVGTLERTFGEDEDNGPYRAVLSVYEHPCLHVFEAARLRVENAQEQLVLESDVGHADILGPGAEHALKPLDWHLLRLIDNAEYFNIESDVCLDDMDGEDIVEEDIPLVRERGPADTFAYEHAHFTEDNKLHCDRGPAVSWPDGSRSWALNGELLPDEVRLMADRLFKEGIPLDAQFDAGTLTLAGSPTSQVSFDLSLERNVLALTSTRANGSGRCFVLIGDETDRGGDVFMSTAEHKKGVTVPETEKCGVIPLQQLGHTLEEHLLEFVATEKEAAQPPKKSRTADRGR